MERTYSTRELTIRFVELVLMELSSCVADNMRRLPRAQRCSAQRRSLQPPAAQTLPGGCLPSLISAAATAMRLQPSCERTSLALSLLSVLTELSIPEQIKPLWPRDSTPSLGTHRARLNYPTIVDSLRSVAARCCCLLERRQPSIVSRLQV